MVFGKVMARMEPGRRMAVEQRLKTLAAASAVGRQIEQNIRNEGRLPESAAEDILETLTDTPNDSMKLREAYQLACRRHILEGHGMHGSLPGLLGRVSSTDAFCHMLFDMGLFDSMGHAKEEVRYWVRISVEDLAKRKVPLGRYVMWATYNKARRQENPFADLPLGADDIRKELGIPWREQGKPLLMFIYKPAPGVLLRFPTVADAQWHDLFRPALDGPEIESGLTMPLDSEGVPRPEVVHEPVDSGSLAAPLEERKP